MAGLADKLVISNWDGYIPKDMADKFKDATGIDLENAAHATNEDIMGTIARQMTIGCDSLSKAVTVEIAAIENGLPALVDAREIISSFQNLIRPKNSTVLPSWPEKASTGLVASFASGVRKNEAQVRAAIESRWSNGQTEGQITKVELVKRQMYGRAKIDLLQARMIGVA
jgi:hypothetical protein